MNEGRVRFVGFDFCGARVAGFDSPPGSGRSSRSIR